jgi:hypothetical protein
MRTDEEILNDAADRASQILRIPHTYLDKVKFIRLYLLLRVVVGDNEENMRWWLNNYNNHLEFVPASKLTEEYYMNKIISYLESFVEK